MKQTDCISLSLQIKTLVGAVYEITAAEDIITPDGTLRYAKGTVVDTVTTDENGNAESGPLYLGKYTVREIKSALRHGAERHGKDRGADLCGRNRGDHRNGGGALQRPSEGGVSLSKILGKDEIFGIGNNGEILSVQFGLYAAEDLTAADGTVIPKDGLLEIAKL